MFGYKGRAGLSRSTPSNVQCQKCLKRGHYSYECKSSSQERPYVSRPSRSQQLRNPKLVPKLTNDTPNPLEKKTGAADEELAKREAARAKKEELHDGEYDSPGSRQSRQASISADSVSTISTNSRGHSPIPKRISRFRSPLPRRKGRDVSGSVLPPPRESSSRSRSPRRSTSRSLSRSQSPPRRSVVRERRSDRGSLPQLSGEDSHYRRPMRQRPYDPPSPEGPSARSTEQRFRGNRNEPPEERRHGTREISRPQRSIQQERERSLSPFSKRLALTRETRGDR